MIRPKFDANFGARYSTVIVPNVANNSQRPVAKAFCLQNNLQYGLI
jgi:hypothetical protein